MEGSILADTGALLALLDGDDEWHVQCVNTFRNLRLPLLTSEAVLAELFHLMRRNGYDPRVTWKFLRSGYISLVPIGDSDLPEIQSLMVQYADRPMDFADATLVHLARRELLSTIFTVDHDDFETYRIDGRRRFRVLPGRTAF